MSKLTDQNQFIDLSDYGRPFGRFLANLLKNTRFTPIHVTFLFGICGLAAIYCILNHYYLTAGFLIVLKSAIDAADGELARIKQTPSYSGRYLDSIFDFILNFLLIMTICEVAEKPIWIAIVAFLCMQLQGTLYNYYYVILRNKSVGGDRTSKIFEYKIPEALPGESKKAVAMLFGIYMVLYGTFDKIIYLLDHDARKVKIFPNWFMTFLSVYGLGFQLMIIALMLPLGWMNYIVPFFIAYTVLIIPLILIRKGYIK